MNSGGGVYRIAGSGPKKREGSSAAFSEFARKCCMAMTSDLLVRLADTWELPAECIKPFYPGWSENDDAYTFPEFDGADNVIGVEFRRPKRGTSDEKWMLKYSKRGICAPKNLLKLPDPVLIVEGHKKAAACLAVGLTAVSRFNNVGGGQFLAKRLRGRDVVVMGDYDPKENGTFPGQTGAIKVSKFLSHQWGVPVRRSFPPNKCKDIHEDVVVPALKKGEDPAEFGRWLLSRIKEISEHEQPATDGEASTIDSICNVTETIAEGKPKRFIVPLDSILANLKAARGDWPRRLGESLFYCDESEKPVGVLPRADDFILFDKPDHLFAWLHKGSRVHWATKEGLDTETGEKSTPITKGEFFSAVVTAAEQRYESVECLPHWPPYEESYYLPMKLPKSDGSALAELVSMFNAATEMDRDLLEAMLLTMFWGGPYGERPAFVIQSEHKQGAGKTTTAKILARIAGGYIMVTEKEDWEKVRTRVLTKSSLGKRVIIIDNVKGRMNSAGLEAAITSDMIDGHRMYAGNAERPNNITWIITANTPKLSTDISDRAVVINIGPKKHGTRFSSKIRTFMRERRAEVIADIMHKLEHGTRYELPDEARDRWGSWLDDIICLFEHPEDMVAYMTGQRETVNQDMKDAADIHMLIAMIARWKGMGDDLSKIKLGVRKAELHEWGVNEGIVDKRFSVNNLTSHIENLLAQPPLKNQLKENPSNRHGRSWLWTGEHADPKDLVIYYDMKTEGAPFRPGLYGPQKPREEQQEAAADDTGEIPF